MTLSFSRLFAWPDLRPLLSSMRAWLGAKSQSPSGARVIDPASLPEALQRDLGLLDGRGPSHRRPERDPRLGPWIWR